MKKTSAFKPFYLLFYFLITLSLSAQNNLEKASPESQGLSSEKLNDLNSIMHSYVDNNDFSAIQTAIVKNGKIVHFDSYGYSDISENDKLERNDIFRIASMTKPIVSIGLMMLYEEGKFQLDDPVYKYIPEFKCYYKPDYRQEIAESWPNSIDDTCAREEWGWKPEWDLDSMTRDMLEHLGQRKELGNLF